jgi:hypothetical protein
MPGEARSGSSARLGVVPLAGVRCHRSLMPRRKLEGSSSGKVRWTSCLVFWQGNGRGRRSRARRAALHRAAPRWRYRAAAPPIAPAGRVPAAIASVMHYGSILPRPGARGAPGARLTQQMRNPRGNCVAPRREPGPSRPHGPPHCCLHSSKHIRSSSTDAERDGERAARGNGAPAYRAAPGPNSGRGDATTGHNACLSGLKSAHRAPLPPR